MRNLISICKSFILLFVSFGFIACSGKKVSQTRVPTKTSAANATTDGSTDATTTGSSTTTPPVQQTAAEVMEGLQEEEIVEITLGTPNFTAPAEALNTTQGDYTFTWTSDGDEIFYQVKSCQEADCSSNTCNEPFLIQNPNFNGDLSFHRNHFLCARSTDGGANFSPWAVSEGIYRRSVPQDIQIIDYKFDLDIVSGSEIGKLSVANADPNSSYTFEIVPGVLQENLFSLKNAEDDATTQNNILVAQLEPTEDGEYSIEMKVSNNHGDEFRKVFTFSIGAELLPPTDIGLTETVIEENKGPGAIIGFLSTTDSTPGDFHNYSLVEIAGSDDHNSFEIEGTVLKTKADFDYETKQGYTIMINSTDVAGNSYAKEFNITVTCQMGLEQIGAYCFEDDGVRETRVFSVNFSAVVLANTTEPKEGDFVNNKFLSQVSPGDTVSVNFNWGTDETRPENQYCPGCIVYFPYGFVRILEDGSREITKLGCVAAGTRTPGQSNKPVSANFEIPAGDGSKGVYMLKQFKAALQYTCDNSPLTAQLEARDLAIIIVD